jgi:hypothetical protein
MQRLRALAANLALSVGAIIFTLVVFELIVFRFFLPGTDLPRNAFVDGVIRYAPNQTGVWRVRSEIAAPYAINAQGWNSGVGDYAAPRQPGVKRIAVIGDSYVEALQVPHDASLAEHIARGLAKAGTPAEAYRFAISGAPMSQYLHMAEREVAKYRPDWIVVLLISNDYDESYRFYPGRYTSSFRKLRVENGVVTGEIPPTRWRSGWAELLRQTATFRFLVFRWQAAPVRLSEALFSPARAQAAGADRDIAAATHYTFGRLDLAARAMGARLLVVTNGDIGAISDGLDETRARALNRIAKSAAATLGIAFLDLDPTFARDWAEHRQRFNFSSDVHWNARAHALAGEAITRLLLEPPQ